jgi:hypothetical protein
MIPIQCCPRLRKLTLIKCANVTFSGMNELVKTISHTPANTQLNIVWKRSDFDGLAGWYLQLIREPRVLPVHVRSKYIPKVLPGIGICLLFIYYN